MQSVEVERYFEAPVEDVWKICIVRRCRFDSVIPGLFGVMRFFVARVFRTALDGLARHSFPKASD